MIYFCLLGIYIVKQTLKFKNMLITISILILAYMIMGKDVNSLLERVKGVDWSGKINKLMDML